MMKMFNEVNIGVQISNTKDNVAGGITDTVDSKSWVYNGFKGSVKPKTKRAKKKAKKSETTKNSKSVETVKSVENSSVIDNGTPEITETADTNNKIIPIPRGKANSLLQVAINNKGKVFAKKNDELKYAEKHPYILKEEILTKAETSLFFIMNKTFNSLLECIGKGIVIFPKIRLADIIEVSTPLKSRKELLYRIAYKHIDYLICDRDTLGLVCAVELDDFYHNRSEKIARDNFVDSTLRDCGVQIFRVNIPIKNVTPASLDNISDYILDYYSPICPECGKIMMSMKSRRSKTYGHRFYGCSGWKPEGDGCNFSININ